MCSDGSRTSETRHSKRTLLPAFLLGLTLLLDIGSFRAQVLQKKSMPLEPPLTVDPLFEAVRIHYQPIRGSLSPDEPKQAAVDRLSRQLDAWQNGVTCTFAGFDPCRLWFRTNMIARGVREMILARPGNPAAYMGQDNLPIEDEPFSRSLGCGRGAPPAGLTPAAGQPASRVRLPRLPQVLSHRLGHPSSLGGDRGDDASRRQREAQDNGRAVRHDGVLDAVELRPARFPIIRVRGERLIEGPGCTIPP
jgi:hypothetical protein